MTTAIDTARAAYIARFDNLAAAVEFEHHTLGIGREFLPECALAVIADRDAATVEYYEWLLDQANEAHDTADGEPEDDGKLTLDAATAAAISTGKTVLDVPVDAEWLKLRREDVTASEHAEFTFTSRMQHQPATEWADLQTEAARLLAEVESAYEAAKGQWTGRTWDDGNKVTPESTDDQIAAMLTREDDIKVTCWGADESDNAWHSRVRAAVADLTAMWNRDELGERFYKTMETLRELAAESDAGVAERARMAETDATEAIREARAGNKHSALVHAEHAAKVEREFGDAPTWGPFCEAMRAYYEHDSE